MLPLDIANLVLSLSDRREAKPNMFLTIHKIVESADKQAIGMDLTITNISGSSYSASAFRLNDKESILDAEFKYTNSEYPILYSWIFGHNKPYFDEYALPGIPVFPTTVYLSPKQSVRGLAFWTNEFEDDTDFEISTMILSDNKRISARISRPTT